MRLEDKLKGLDTYPFHMPGHKRNKKFGITGSEIDITEIDGFDNLHCPRGVIADIENDLKKIYKSKKSLISVNGSSMGIMSAIFAVCNRKDKIIVARNCHKSVFNACMLLELKIIYIEPDYDSTNGYYMRLSQEAADRTVRENPDAKAMIITSPTYEGFISEIECNIPLIIDAAHGAHLGQGYFPKYPKGDIVISSLHKTLPSLTQTAVINIYSERLIERVKRFNDIFQTTSPSYILMNSISICADYVLKNRRDFCAFYENLCDLRLADTNNLRIMYTDDISKIIVSTAGTDISGNDLADILRDKYKIEVEAYYKTYVLLMTSVADEKEKLEYLKKALEEIDEGLICKYEKLIKKPPCPDKAMQIKIDDEGDETEIEKSVGKVSNEFVYAYPPDIPIIVPNEVISREAIEYIKESIKDGVNIISDSTLIPNKILTKKAN